LNRELYLANENLVSVLNNSLAATKTLSYIITLYGVHNDFEVLAKQILENNKNIDALELVEGGTITHIYPLEENRSALGYNILEDSLVNKEAYRAIKENKLFFAGPIRLRQGYLAIVGRLPIYKDGKFWGFSAVLIKLSTLIKAAHLDFHGRKDIVFQLSKTDPNTGKEQNFLPDSNFAKRKFSASMHVPMGDWRLQAGLLAPPYDFHPRVLFFGVLLSAIGGLFTWYFLRQPKRLRDLVNEKTTQLQKSEEKYYSFFDQSSDAILVIDNNGHLVEVNQRLCRMLDFSRQELLGMSFRNILDPVQPGDKPLQLDEVMSGDQVIRQRRFVTKNGDFLTVEITSKKISGDICLLTCRDVS
jgi:PAS domain S-box-containing protein